MLKLEFGIQIQQGWQFLHYSQNAREMKTSIKYRFSHIFDKKNILKNLHLKHLQHKLCHFREKFNFALRLKFALNSTADKFLILTFIQ